MTLTTLITVNAFLDLAVVLAVLAVIRFAHRLPAHQDLGETAHPSQPISLRLALASDEADELSRAA